MIGRTGVVGVGLPPSTYHALTHTRSYTRSRTRATFERVVRVPRVAATSAKRSPVGTVKDKIERGSVGGTCWLAESFVMQRSG